MIKETASLDGAARRYHSDNVTPAAVFSIAIICALIGIPIGRWKNAWWRGFLAGLILGPLGLIIMLIIPASEETRIRREQQRIRARREAARREGRG